MADDQLPSIERRRLKTTVSLRKTDGGGGILKISEHFHNLMEEVTDNFDAARDSPIEIFAKQANQITKHTLESSRRHTTHIGISNRFSA